MTGNLNLSSIYNNYFLTS